MSSKVKLFGGGVIPCRIIRFKKYCFNCPDSVEIEYLDFKCGYTKTARYPLHRLVLSDYDKRQFKDEIVNYEF